MPEQELFFTQHAGDRRVDVLKTYDQLFAREAFGNMDEQALARLWTSLDIADRYEREDIPSLTDPNREDFLWEELVDAAREDGNLLSFFVVTTSTGNTTASLYVSPDWPSAEAVAKSLIRTPLGNI